MVEKGAKQQGSNSSKSGDAGSAVGGVLVFLGMLVVFVGSSSGVFLYPGFALMIFGLTFVLYDILRVLREIRDK